MNAIGIIQARMGSTRLPGKVLMPLGGQPSLFHVVERCRSAATLSRVIVATSTHVQDNAIAAFCRERGFDCFRGSESDVLDRYYQCARQHRPDVVVRITADCPLVVPAGIDEVVHTLERETLDFCIWDLQRIPLGLATEALRYTALEEAAQEATQTPEREHVTMFVHDNPDRYRVLWMPTKLCPNRPDLRLTVDTPEDYAVLNAVYDALYKPGTLIDIFDVERFLDAHPNIARLNSHIEQKKV